MKKDKKKFKTCEGCPANKKKDCIKHNKCMAKPGARKIYSGY
jgi:hypothetical protein